MSNLFKDIYSPDFYSQFCDVLASLIPEFNKKKFTQLIFDEGWKEKELKERMKHTSTVLHHFFPKVYLQASSLICNLIAKLREKGIKEQSIEYMFLPNYIECYGINDYETSIQTIEYLTQFTSCEFAVRPFIIKYGDKMIAQMNKWSLHKNYKVRRLSSEGSRPRLPWAIALPMLKKDPTSILPILENLKQDPSDFVRRSVANNLNDISKDNPEIVMAIIKKWKAIGTKETDWMIKHGCRTLLKTAHTRALHYFGLQSTNSIEVKNFSILTPTVRIGKELMFVFTLINNHAKPRKVRVEYGLYYKKSNGSLSRKVFKISEREYLHGKVIEFKRKQSFKLITTRKFYPGEHKLSLILNGEEKGARTFLLSE